MKRDLDWINDNRLTQRQFDALPKEKQRVYIARDVLAQLQLGKLNPKSGTYLYTKALASANIKERDLKRDVGDVVLREPCTACAIGSIFACAVHIADHAPLAGFLDHVTSTGVAHGDVLKQYLDRFFTREQQALIEAAFEHTDIGSQCALAHIDRDTTDAAVRFNHGINSRRVRLTRIMRNIIRNGGDFDPKDTTLAAR